MPKDQGIISWKDLVMGMYIVEPGNSEKFKTGDWKSHRPVLDKEKCIKCAQCYILCPEPAYYEDSEGYFICNLDYCKGCGICAAICPKGAITMVLEEA